MICKNCNKLLSELSPTCEECVSELETNLNSAHNDIRMYIRGIGELKAENAALKADNAAIIKWFKASRLACNVKADPNKILSDLAEAIDKHILSTDHPGAALLEELAQVKKALAKSCKLFVEYTEFCPSAYSGEDMYLRCSFCNETESFADCWKEYYLQQAKAELKGAEGNG